MNAHHPSTTPSYCYDSAYASFGGSSVPIFGYDVSESWFASPNFAVSVGPGANSLQFTGQERDDGPGLDYFAARYFASSLGRFTSPNPLSVGADLYSPQSWNGHAYVANSPLSAVDPSGMADNSVDARSFHPQVSVRAAIAPGIAQSLPVGRRPREPLAFMPHNNYG